MTRPGAIPNLDMSARWRLGLVISALIVVAAGASPTTPPDQVVLHAGYDAQGGSWSVSAGRAQPLRIVGPKTFTPELQAPVEFMSLRATIDRDTLWIADGSPRLLSVSLADGSAKETKLPVPRISDLAVRNGTLLAAFSDSAGVSRVLRFDLAAERGEHIFEVRPPNSLLSIDIGRANTWIATWTGLGPARVRVDLTGVPNAKAVAGQPPVRNVLASREVEWAAERWPGFAVHEDDTGNVWLAHTYAGRVERLDAAGTWTTWTVAPERLVSLTVVGSRALALVATMAPVDLLAPPGIAQTLLSRSLVVIDPGSKDLLRTSLAPGTPVQSLLSAGGRVWIANSREVRIVDGRAVITEAK